MLRKKGLPAISAEFNSVATILSAIFWEGVEKTTSERSLPEREI